MGKLAKVLACIAIAIAAGCSSSSDTTAPVGLADGCNINSDCSQPLVCAFRHCHTACESSRDCPDNQRCMASDRPFHVCQLPTETKCSYNSDCPTGQVCGVDGQCRDQCANDRDCVSGQVCTQGTCAEPAELDAGKLPPTEVEAGDEKDVVTGQPCSYNSECTAPLICRTGYCGLECLGDSDCADGLSCIASRCKVAPADAQADAGEDAQACAYNSECASPLVCRQGVCGYECLGDADCAEGQACVASRCKAPAPDAQADTGGDAQACVYNSECASPLICRQGSCAYECLGDADCATGEACVSYRCEAVDAGAVDAGPDAQACSYNSQCASPLICRQGACAYECLGNADCATGQTCVANRCKAPVVDASVDAPVDAPTGWGTGCTYNSECTTPLVCRQGACAYECLGDADCSTGEVCVANRCGAPVPDASVDADASLDGGADVSTDACVPTTCLAQSANCGLLQDGCGSTLDCGGCASGQTCGGGGIANVCGAGTCSPKSCAAQSKNCGTISDGCSWLLQCGTCTNPQTCGGGGVANVCGCKSDAVTACAGKDCGQVIDNCGQTVTCGTCNLPQTCGGGGTPNLCGCSKTSCAAQGKNCGIIADGCGGQLDCGGCDGGVCGGGGTANVCGSGTCTATDCTTAGKNCGVISDGCGNILACGSCTAPQTCGGAGTANVCGCTKTSCAAQSANCGTIADGCGGTLSCGSCTNGTCGGGGKANVCGCTPTSCAAQGKDCGTISDGCGGLLACGTCSSPQVCGGGGIPNLCAVQQTPPSCQGGGFGAGHTCGINNDDCCSSLLVPAGSFNRSNDPSYPGSVADFRLDRYEVTVGRYRAFLASAPGAGTQQLPPVAWTGAHPAIPTSGWNPTWNGFLMPDQATMTSRMRDGAQCWNGDGYGTWTATSANSDSNPVNCVNWYEAMAFCAWDNAWLVTEVEYNYAQEGGGEQRYYPWSSPPGSTTENFTYANFGGCSAGGPNFAIAVGSKSTKGDGKWGHTDLVGNMSQWMMDVWNTPYYYTSCADCAYLGTATTLHVIRGGSWNECPWNYSTRDNRDHTYRDSRVGFRCARLP